MKVNIPIIVTLLNNYFKDMNIVYKYDNINHEILLCNYMEDAFYIITFEQLIKDFQFYILSSKYYKTESLKLLNKITLF